MNQLKVPQELSSTPLSLTAEDLRKDFDASFAVPPLLQAGEGFDVLMIRVGNEPFAIRASDLAGLDARRRIVPMPARDPNLLGIAGINGQLVPVYSLAMLLGQKSPEEPLWLAMVGKEIPVALAFGVLEGYLRVSPEARHVPEDGARRYVREALQLASGVRYILDLDSVVIAIHERAGLRRNESQVTALQVPEANPGR